MAAGAAAGAGQALTSGIMGGLSSAQFGALSAEQQQFLMDQLGKIEGISAPTFNTNLPAPQQLALQQYANPTLGQQTNVQIDPQDRMQQQAALQKLQAVSSGAADSELNAANYRAMQNAAQQEQGANQGILANMASRGTLGSGQELAAKMQAAQNGANNSQSGMLQAAAANNQARLGAQNSLIQGLSNLRGQDTSLASENANIANQFNMYNTGLKNKTAEANTGLTNQSNIYNTGNNNAYQQALIALQNSAGQQTFQDKLGQAQAGAGEANTISNNTMNAGTTGIALGANTASGIAQGAGNLGNALSSLQGGDGGYQNVDDPEQAPKANDNEEMSFDGR